VNFYDLDAITQGLQRSDLIIVAGRPVLVNSRIAVLTPAQGRNTPLGSDTTPSRKCSSTSCCLSDLWAL
jgi:hypothetical protein